jgi:hypothetical protein
MRILFACFFSFSGLHALEKSDLIGIWQLEIHWDLTSCISESQTKLNNSFLLFDSTWLKMVTIENSKEKSEIMREFEATWRIENDSLLAIKQAWYSVDSSDHFRSGISTHQTYINFGVIHSDQTLAILGKNFAPTLGKICQYKSVYGKRSSIQDSAVFFRSYKKYLKK